MKTIYFILLAAILLLPGCSNEGEEEGVEKNTFFTLAIQFVDNKGESLISTQDDTFVYKRGYYDKSNLNITFKNSDLCDLDYDIVKTDNGETELQIRINSKSCKKQSEMEIYISNDYFKDKIICEYIVNEGKADIQKIWLNDYEFGADDYNIENPLIKIVKPKFYEYGEVPDAKPIELRNATKVSVDNKFALELFKSIYKNTDGKNIFISPLSVNFALNMLLNGADNKTKEELINTLQAIGFSLTEINEHSRELYNALNDVDPLTEFTSANSIWIKNNLSLKNDFIQTNKTYFNAEVYNIDFALPTALKTINDWCAKNTNNKIKNAVEDFSPETLMALINTVYFKSNWYNLFKTENTREDDFTNEDGNIEKVDMMYQLYYDAMHKTDANAQYLKLPLGNKAFNMTIILPNEGKTIKDIIENIGTEWSSSEFFTEGKYIYEVLRDIDVYIPRFKINCSYNMAKDILPAMGMKLSFTSDADFSKICNEQLFINKAIHKTYIDVNEEGVEASAVTAFELIYDAGEGFVPPIFKVNRPFIFAICEDSSGAILFMGKVGKIVE